MALNLALGLGLTGLGALSGLFGKKQTSDTSYSQSSMPSYDPTNLSFRDFLIGQYRNNLENQGNFEQAYTTGGLRNIGRTNASAASALGDLYTSRGIGGTAAAAGTGNLAFANANRTADFLNNIPIIMDQLKQAKLGAAAGYQASLPVGTTSSGTSHTVGSVPGGFGPAIQGGASGLAGFLGQYAAQKQFGDILKTIGAGKTGYA